jgi:uncharacterized protein YegJ (DUF2314 family)
VFQALVVLLALSACQGPGRVAEPVPPVALAPGRLPVPQGPLRASHVLLQYGLYFAPTPKTDPMAAVEGPCEPARDGLTRGAVFVPAPSVASLFVERPSVAAFAPPDVESLAYFGRGLTPAQEEDLQRSADPLVLSVSAPSDAAADAARRGGTLAACLAAQTDGLIWDEQTRLLYSTARFGEVEAALARDVLSLPDHVTIHAYEDGGSLRAITLGMQKFGLPDVVVAGFGTNTSTQMGHLVNLVAQTLFEQDTLVTEGRLPIDARALRDTKLRDTLASQMLPGATGRAVLHIGIGEPQDGDPDNALIEIVFDEPERGSVAEQQYLLLDALFGSSDTGTPVTHTPEVLAASALARADLENLRARFARGLAPNEALLVKAPFSTSDGGNEWMWVEVTGWHARTIDGILTNQPLDVPDLRAGAAVTLSQDVVFDYLHQLPDGSVEGNATAALLRGSSSVQSEQ